MYWDNLIKIKLYWNRRVTSLFFFNLLLLTVDWWVYFWVSNLLTISLNLISSKDKSYMRFAYFRNFLKYLESFFKYQSKSVFTNSILENNNFHPFGVLSQLITSLSKVMIPSIDDHQNLSNLSIIPGQSRPNKFKFISFESILSQNIVKVLEEIEIVKHFL